jgi:hypothetical protein
MTVRPIVAVCRRCGNELLLSEVVDEGTGLCPRCRSLLTPEWVPVLLEEAARVERAHLALVGALHRLVTLPGYLELIPHTVVQNILDEVGWEDVLESEPRLLAEELADLQARLEAWPHLENEARRRDGAGIVDRVRVLARRLRLAGDTVDVDSTRPEAERSGTRARDAADRLDTAADRMTARLDDSGHLQSVVTEALKAAEAARRDRARDADGALNDASAP